MKSIKELFESVLDVDRGEEVLDKAAELECFFRDKEHQREIIKKWQAYFESNSKRLKTATPFKNVASNEWFVKFPKYFGYSDDIMFFKRVGSNYWLYICHRTSTYPKHYVAEFYELRNNLNASNNFIYKVPADMIDTVEDIVHRSEKEF